MAKKNPLIVHELTVRNVGPLKEVHIEPQGDLVELTGPNGAGKSYVLDSIAFALSGANSFKDIPKVTRDGEGDAEIIVDLGDYLVTRNWTDEDHYYLKVTAKMDGEDFDVKSPQSVLDTFGQTIGVDPLELAQKKATQARKDFLRSLVDVDLDALDQKRQELYSQRRDVGRDVKKAKAQLDGMEAPPQDLPEPVDTQEVMEQLEEAQKRNSNRDHIESKMETIQENIASHQGTLKNVEGHLEVLVDAKANMAPHLDAISKVQAGIKTRILSEIDSAIENKKQLKEENLDKLKSYQLDLKEGQKWLDEHPEMDVDSLKEKLESAQEIQETRQKAQAYQKTQKEVESGQAEYDRLTQEIEDIDAQKMEAIQGAEMPLDGLDLSDEDITIDGQAFSQYSEGERLKYAALMLIGSEPRFRVLGVKEGEKLDSKNRAILEEVAREHGFQLWLERMDESGEIGYVLKSGEIVKTNKKD